MGLATAGRFSGELLVFSSCLVTLAVRLRGYENIRGSPHVHLKKHTASCRSLGMSLGDMS